MYELKTKLNDASVTAFLNGVTDEGKREDCLKMIDLMSKATGAEPKMWGTAIIGFGGYHYKYESGHEGDAPAVGLSPRKANITVYLTCGAEILENEKAHLGKAKTGKGCLYLKTYADVDEKVLTRMFKSSVQNAKKMNKK